jgi:hypothetical protein
MGRGSMFNNFSPRFHCSATRPGASAAGGPAHSPRASARPYDDHVTMPRSARPGEGDKAHYVTII